MIFPETLIRPSYLTEKIEKKSYSITIGDKSPEELLRELAEKGFETYENSEKMTRSPGLWPHSPTQEIQVVQLELDDFVPHERPTTEEIFAYAKQAGLIILPRKTGPYARLQDTNQKNGGWYYIAAKPIIIDGEPRIFENTHYMKNFQLASITALPSDEWSLHETFLFGVPNIYTQRYMRRGIHS